MPRKWVEDLTITYDAKPGKDHKKVVIPEDNHLKMARAVTMIYESVGIGEEIDKHGKPKPRNYLAVSFSFIVSTKAFNLEDHGRTYISFPFYIQDQPLVTRRQLGLANPTTQKGWDTEQVLYTYLSSAHGSEYLYNEFANKVSEASKDGKINLEDKKNISPIKIYGLVLSMHGYFQMCAYPEDGTSCSVVTFAAINPVTIGNLRTTIASIFLKKYHHVSGFNPPGGDPVARAGKIPLKMSVLYSYTVSIFAPDRSKTEKKILEAINKPESANQNIYLKNINYKLTEDDKKPSSYKDIRYTILRSSSKLVISWRFKTDIEREAWDNIRRLLNFAPKVLKFDLKDIPKEKIDRVRYSLLYAAIINNDFPIANLCFFSGAILPECYYGHRMDVGGRALVTFPDDEGYTYLGGTVEAGKMKKAIRMVNAAGLSEDEMSISHGDLIREYAATSIQKIGRGYIGRILGRKEGEQQKKSWVEFIDKQPDFLREALSGASIYERRSYERIVKAEAPGTYLGL